MKTFQRVALFVSVASIGVAAAACGAEPATAPKDPVGGAVNTDGKPDPSKQNGSLNTGSDANTAGKPDPSKTNKPDDPVGGKVNSGGAPDFGKTNILGKDAGK